MSFDFNYKFWVATKKDINSIIKRQNVLKKLQPIQNPLITYKIFSELYVLYVELVNKLGYVYSNTFQVQKRKIVRVLVESATRRLLELKNELKNLELSEYVYTDKALISRRLTPYDLVIWRSPQFLFKRSPEIQNIIYNNKIFPNEEERKEEEIQIRLKIKDSVILIQAHERARRNRVYFSAIKHDKSNLKIVMYRKATYTFSHKAEQTMIVPVKRTTFNSNFIKSNIQCRGLLKVENLETVSYDDKYVEELKSKQNKASGIIQRAWRAYKKRKVHKNNVLCKQTLYGMRRKRRLIKPNEYEDSVVETYKKEILKQKLNDDFVNLMMNERVRLLQARGPWIMEDISDHIRAWFREFYDTVGNFHPFPEEIKSGTVLVLIKETMTPIELMEKLNEKNLSKEEKKKRAEKLRLLKQKEKEKRRKDKIKEAKRRKKMKDAGIMDIGGSLKENKNIEQIESTIKQYSIDWRLVDEYLNKNHEAITEWVTEGELAIIHKELRGLVDEFMRIEHELLERALAADNKKKYKQPKRKKSKNKKEKKKRVPKDLTENRSIESLYHELREAGIIEKYTNKQFADFVAEFSYIADNLRDEDNLTILGPAKGDIKMVIQETMLGMGEFTVDKPKSVLLFGPLNNGKRLLCNIIATELDAVFMNLSPENTAKFQNDLIYFLHVVMKVAKAFQPTILFIQDVHRIFWKKVPKDQENIKPRLLQKTLMKKIIKPIKKDEKIMVIGTSNIPWSAKSGIKKAFQKILFVPKNDYGSSFLIWLEFLERFAGDDNVDDHVISSLAKVLQNYTSGDLTDNISETLNIRRRMHLKTTPLLPGEFLEHFYKDEELPKFPPETKIMEKYSKWFTKSNKLAKQRIKFQNKKKKKGK